jgi:pyruvate dehydrogenase (quinone)
VSTEFRDKLVGRRIRAAETHRSKAVASSRGTIPPIYLTELINRHAAGDALFCADDGTPTVCTHRHARSISNTSSRKMTVAKRMLLIKHVPE